MVNYFIALMLICGLMFSVWPRTGSAQHWLSSPGNSHVCDAAAEKASRDVGVPLAVMKAIARVESGRTKSGQFSPWPWTINTQGEGVFLPDLKSAAALVRKNYAAGARSIDVGCFQINLKWHGKHFDTAEQMLNPYNNARYAATFLRKLYDELNNWHEAAAAYHSRNAEHSKPYLAKFRSALANLEADNPDRPSLSNKAQSNSFPLLTGSSTSVSHGSLFPRTGTPNRTSFIAQDGRG
ncbi:MAG: transglycosylase SLT domain-containing protein [Roseobacter sp.]|jgi:hypothetical protein|nr:transglycosylase SLT domain-containing protein [Roseobacter sp.]